MNKLQLFIRKWLGIDKIHAKVDDHSNELDAIATYRITRPEVEAMLAEHFKEIQEFFTKPEPPKVEEKKPLVSRVRNFSQFRDKVESSVFSED